MIVAEVGIVSKQILFPILVLYAADRYAHRASLGGMRLLTAACHEHRDQGERSWNDHMTRQRAMHEPPRPALFIQPLAEWGYGGIPIPDGVERRSAKPCIHELLH